MKIWTEILEFLELNAWYWMGSERPLMRFERPVMGNEGHVLGI